MKLLFVQGGTRLKEDYAGNLYTDGNLNNKVWERYKNYCDQLLIVLRAEEKKYETNYALNNFNTLDKNKTKVYRIKDLMRPKYRFFSLKCRKQAIKQIELAVKECDKAIIRSAHNFYTLTAIKLCEKYNKPYLIEVAGYAFDGYWTHGDLYGKIVAIPYELLAKKAMKKAKYCVYVTNYSLQKRYPCYGKTLGCSDVELNKLNYQDLQEKLEKIKGKEKLILGTIGWLNIKLKGQQDVIKTLSKLKKEGIDRFEYQLVGLGKHKYLDRLIQKYNLKDNVKILGSMPHEQIFDWFKQIDVYIQPSHTEGLCRAIVEAMSMACPIIVSNAGGNPELANCEFVFRKRNYKQLKKILIKINNNNLANETIRSFEEAKKYQKEILDKKRNNFYKQFINE